MKIPPEVQEHTGLDKLKEDDAPDELDMYIQREESHHGKYYSFWPSDQGEDDE